MNDMLVCCSGLTKSYGAKPALDHVDLQLAPGKIIGLLGPNGSGKTTLIKILTGLLRQTEGSVAIDGKPIGPETKALVSYRAGYAREDDVEGHEGEAPAAARHEPRRKALPARRADRGRRSGRARLYPADDPDELFAREHRPDLDAPDRGHRAGA